MQRQERAAGAMARSASVAAELSGLFDAGEQGEKVWEAAAERALLLALKRESDPAPPTAAEIAGWAEATRRENGLGAELEGLLAEVAGLKAELGLSDQVASSPRGSPSREEQALQGSV